MRTYYFDDSGKRSLDPACPYFVVGGFGINANELPLLKNGLESVCHMYGFKTGYPRELKFNLIGRQKDNRASRPHWLLQAGLNKMEERRAFVYSVLRKVSLIPSFEALTVAIDNRAIPEQKSPIEVAVTPLFERIQMNAQVHDRQALVMMDEEQAADKALRATLRNGSQYVKYNRISDTIAFMPSEESPGVQVADLIAGSVGRHLNFDDPGYLRVLWKRFAQKDGKANGIGTKLYPRGTFPPPAPRPGTWNTLDRKVHEIEMAKHGVSKFYWHSDGTPNYIWPADSYS